MEKIYFPSGYPYLLFVNEFNNSPKFFLAISEEHANKQSCQGTVDTVKVADLITAFGHKQTHDFFKKFGECWMTKEGMAFFKTNSAIGI